VVDGAMTLVSDSYASRNDKFLDDFHGLIRDAMNDGDFSKVHPDIIDISYWNRKTFANVVAESISRSQCSKHDAASLFLVLCWNWSGRLSSLRWCGE
jgi:hypothetical protein